MPDAPTPDSPNDQLLVSAAARVLRRRLQLPVARIITEGHSRATVRPSVQILWVWSISRRQGLLLAVTEDSAH